MVSKPWSRFCMLSTNSVVWSRMGCQQLTNTLLLKNTLVRFLCVCLYLLLAIEHCPAELKAWVLTDQILILVLFVTFETAGTDWFIRGLICAWILCPLPLPFPQPHAHSRTRAHIHTRTHAHTDTHRLCMHLLLRCVTHFGSQCAEQFHTGVFLFMFNLASRRTTGLWIVEVVVVGVVVWGMLISLCCQNNTFKEQRQLCKQPSVIHCFLFSLFLFSFFLSFFFTI